jgi:chemotaxis signal transduction protein
MTDHYIPFFLKGEPFFLSAHVVREILGRQACTQVPHATSHVPGVFPWKGRAVALMDLVSLLHMESAGCAQERTESVENGQRTLVVQWADEVFGFSVDNVLEPVAIDSERFRPIHAADGLFTEAEVEWSDRIVRLLDVPAMLRACFQSG